MIKAVIFDFDNTLYNFDSAHEHAIQKAAAYAQEQLAIPAEVFLTAYQESIRELEERTGYICASTHNRFLRMQLILEKFNKPLFPHVRNLYHSYWDTLMEQSILEPCVTEILTYLTEEGYYIGLGTNMTAYMQFEKLERLGISHFFHGIVTSEEIGVDKPETKFFLRCAEKAGVLPEECLFVGDSIKYDIEGAGKSGMKAVWYCPIVNPERKELPGIPAIYHMSELKDLIKKLD